MGLEAATHVNQLVATNPVGATDPKSQGDDHLRLIKDVLVRDFVNIGGVVNASHTQLNNLASLAARSVLGTAGGAAAAPAAITASADGQVLARESGSLVFSVNYPMLNAANVFTNASNKITTAASSPRWWLDDGTLTASFQIDSTNDWAQLGVHSAHALRFFTNNAHAMAIDSAGNFDFFDGTVLTSVLSASEVGFRGMPPLDEATGYTLRLSDAGKMIVATGGQTYTIPANSSVAFPRGTIIELVNYNGSGNVTVAITTDTLYLLGANFGVTGSRTVAIGGKIVLEKVANTAWVCSGPGVS